MQLHELKPKTKNKSKKRIGRGGARGTYSGKGLKGQKSRAGHRIRPEIRDIIKKLPKKRGYSMPQIQKKPDTVNVGVLDKFFGDSETITPKLLAEKKIIKRLGGKLPKVKILGSGDVSKKLLVKDCQISDSAKKKIEKAGGSIKLKTKNEKVKNNPSPTRGRA